MQDPDDRLHTRAAPTPDDYPNFPLPPSSEGAEFAVLDHRPGCDWAVVLPLFCECGALVRLTCTRCDKTARSHVSASRPQ